MLLGRPTPPRTETVNDLDCFISNFWRSTIADPEAVAHYADYPVNEADLHARHQWLVNQLEFREHMKTDPAYFDAKIAGWWVWGISQWIGSGWCSRPEWRGRSNASTAARGVHQKRPQIKTGGVGVHSHMSRKIPSISTGGVGVHRSALDSPLIELFSDLRDRLRDVRVCCGDWKRVLGPSPTTKIGVTGILLDPPYGDVGRDTDLYNEESLTVAAEVREWALANGDNRDLRIALCGYEGEHEMPGWDCVHWKANGGYGNRSGNKNAHRERIWFSRHCLSNGRLF